MQSKSWYIVAIGCLLLIVALKTEGQPGGDLPLNMVKKKFNVLPGSVVNIPLFVKNSTDNTASFNFNIKVPENWDLVTGNEVVTLNPQEKKFLVASVRIPAACLVGNYFVETQLLKQGSNDIVAHEQATVRVAEVEKVSLQLIKSDENIFAGETYRAQYVVQNLGNTEKTIFVETINCEVTGDATIQLKPGQTSIVNIVKKQSA